MADAKWIEGLRDDMPLVEAARQALTVRLGAVRERLPQALYNSAEDIEHVHQLRVSTRRAGAALRIFDVCLPRKAFKRMRDPLRRLRRAAGAARDWDVFLAGLNARRSRPQPKHQAGLDFLLGFGHGQRSSAQDQLLAATQQPPLALDQLVAETLAALRPPSQAGAPATFGDHAVPLFAALLKEFNQAARQDLHDYEHLHQVRILGKRLRYVLEVCACCFVPTFHDQIYPAVTEMQEILGLANDSKVAGSRLEDISLPLKASSAKSWKRLAPGIEGLMHFHQRQLPKQQRLFLAWWKRWECQSRDREGAGGAPTPSRSRL